MSFFEDKTAHFTVAFFLFFVSRIELTPSGPKGFLKSFLDVYLVTSKQGSQLKFLQLQFRHLFNFSHRHLETFLRFKGMI